MAEMVSYRLNRSKKLLKVGDRVYRVNDFRKVNTGFAIPVAGKELLADKDGRGHAPAHILNELEPA